METLFDVVVTPLKIDISTGDAITPREIRYDFKLMLEDRSIQIWAYNLETVLAEKLETVISRSTLNTRMRDYYDIHILFQVYGCDLQKETLSDALSATANKRGTAALLENAGQTIREIEKSTALQDLWSSYRNKYSYAANIPWESVIRSIQAVFLMAQK